MKIQATATFPPTLAYKPSPVISRIGEIARGCFAFLKACLLFPLRFIGAKSWSIPGVIFRLPGLLFQRLIVRAHEPLHRQLFDGGYDVFFEKTLTPDELQPFFPYICATGLVHKAKSEFIPPDWKLITPNTLALKMPGVQLRERDFFDPATGFKACLIEKDKEIIISFSSLEPGVPGDGKPQFCRGKTADIVQLYLGGNPHLFKQAELFVNAIRQHPYTEKKHISLTGNSLGGSLAAYAGLKNGLPAVCSNAVPLSAGQQKEIGTDRLRNARRHITHISVRGDYVTDTFLLRPLDFVLSLLGIRTPGNFGKRYLIPSAYKPWEFLHHHGYTLGSMMEHLGHGYRTKPEDLGAALLT